MEGTTRGLDQIIMAEETSRGLEATIIPLEVARSWVLVSFLLRVVAKKATIANGPTTLEVVEMLALEGAMTTGVDLEDHAARVSPSLGIPLRLDWMESITVQNLFRSNLFL